MFKPRRNLTKGKKRVESSSESDADSKRVIEQTPEAVLDVKKRRHGLESSSSIAPSSSPSTAIEKTSENILIGEDAFRQSEQSGFDSADLLSQYERIRDIQKKIDAGELDEEVYRGMKAYRAYIPPDDGTKLAKRKVTDILGPQRVADNVRSTVQFDYQMDICKDFKESGYCGFGDSCKFLHDRSDYKSGWQLDSDWKASKRSLDKDNIDRFSRKAEKRQARLEQQRQDAIERGLDPSLVVPESDSDTSSNDGGENSKALCCVCHKKWSECKTPACTTICGHFFCESCFLATSANTCKCCGKPTQGIFNSL